MPGIQLIAIAFGVAMLFVTYTAFRRRELAAGETLLWAVVWLALIGVSAFPDRLRDIVGPLKVARLLDLVMIVAILLLSALVFTLNRRVRRLETRIVALVRRLALSAQDAHGDGEQAVGEVHGESHQAAE